MVSSLLPFRLMVAGAPYYALAKEREGAPSFFPRCSSPFLVIYPSLSVSVLILPTNTFHRRYAKGDYVISMHKKRKEELRIGMFAVVGFKVQYSGP